MNDRRPKIADPNLTARHRRSPYLSPRWRNRNVRMPFTAGHLSGQAGTA
jgi:hypothetical protein